MRLAVLLSWLLAGVAFADVSAVKATRFTPTITAAAYADGDQIGVLQSVTDFFPSQGTSYELIGVTLLDKEKAEHDLQILFFDSAVTVASADNAAVDVADAQMAAGYLGTVAFATADYTTVVAGSKTARKATEMFLVPNGTRNLYYLLVCKDSGGCDYGALGDLVVRLEYRRVVQ